MPTYESPHIRDEIVIDDRWSDVDSSFAGDGPVYLLARRVVLRHDLRVGRRPVVIVADEYVGNSYSIDAHGADGVGGGGRGADGARPGGYIDASGVEHPTGPGDSGQPGGAGDPGRDGGAVTLYCRRASDVRIIATGGAGTDGGAGGNGQRGAGGSDAREWTETIDDTPDDLSDFAQHDEYHSVEAVDGTPGGDGGAGGVGGDGGRGGTITFVTVEDPGSPVLRAEGGAGGRGGAGGTAGYDGYRSPTQAAPGYPGANGATVDGHVDRRRVSDAEYAAGLRGVLERSGMPYAEYWAPFRLAMADYLFRQYVPSEAADPRAERAALELARVLELQPDNADALRLQAHLIGTRVPVPIEVVDVPGGTWEAPQITAVPDEPWVGGGANALGIPPDLDVQPHADAYLDAFARFGALVLDVAGTGLAEMLAAGDRQALASVVEQDRQIAIAAAESARADVDIATKEQQLAVDDADHLQQQLASTTAEIEVSLAAMNDSDFDLGGIIGTVAEIGAAVVGVVAAIPSCGTSLVALLPAMVELADVAVTDAGPAAVAVLQGEAPDTEAIKTAYAKVGKQVDAVVASGKRIVDFVKVAQRLGAASSDNPQHLALVKRGAELTHEVLVAQNRVVLAGQRTAAAEARAARADGVAAGTRALQERLATDALAIRDAAEVAINAASVQADALLTLAFLAQRSIEIYTLTDQQRHLALDAGRISPELWRRYAEGEVGPDEVVAALTASWAKLLQPTQMQLDLAVFTALPHDQDRLRLSFPANSPEVAALRAGGRFAFRVEATAIPDGRADAKARSVRLALVGATAPTSEVSCDVRHGGRYEQRRADGTVDAQLLLPQVSTRYAKLAPLAADEGLGGDPPVTDPQSLAFWGRGIGGDWELSIVDPGGVDLSTLTEVQIWIGYQYTRA